MRAKTCLPKPRPGPATNRAVFLDRDGTLNADFGYVHRYEDWRWLPGALEALSLFHQAGWLLVVASNQSGIGRGYFAESDLKALEARVNGECEKSGCPIAAWSYCPHAPGAHCACRKPEPGLLLSASRELDIELSASWMLGDRLRDVEAGYRAGCHAGLVLNPDYPDEWGMVEKKFPGTPVWESLLMAAKEITGGKRV